MTNHMTEADYTAKRETIRATYGDNSRAAGARSAQALASLFHDSGWTQEKLAEAEGKNQGFIARQLCFGRFLSIMPTGHNDLTERKFRSFWERTDKDDDEAQRFEDVTNMLEEDDVSNKAINSAAIGDALNNDKTLRDGKWRSEQTAINQLVKKSGQTEAAVRKYVTNIRSRKLVTKKEEKMVGTDPQIRFFPMDNTISVMEIIEKLTPMLDHLTEQGAKNDVTISLQSIALATKQIRNVIKEWSE